MLVIHQLRSALKAYCQTMYSSEEARKTAADKVISMRYETLQNIEESQQKYVIYYNVYFVLLGYIDDGDIDSIFKILQLELNFNHIMCEENTICPRSKNESKNLSELYILTAASNNFEIMKLIFDYVDRINQETLNQPDFSTDDAARVKQIEMNRLMPYKNVLGLEEPLIILLIKQGSKSNLVELVTFFLNRYPDWLEVLISNKDALEKALDECIQQYKNLRPSGVECIIIPTMPGFKSKESTLLSQIRGAVTFKLFLHGLVTNPVPSAERFSTDESQRQNAAASASCSGAQREAGGISCTSTNDKLPSSPTPTQDNTVAGVVLTAREQRATATTAERPDTQRNSTRLVTYTLPDGSVRHKRLKKAPLERALPFLYSKFSSIFLDSNESFASDIPKMNRYVYNIFTTVMDIVKIDKNLLLSEIEKTLTFHIPDDYQLGMRLSLGEPPADTKLIDHLELCLEIGISRKTDPKQIYSKHSFVILGFNANDKNNPQVEPHFYSQVDFNACIINMEYSNPKIMQLKQVLASFFNFRNEEDAQSFLQPYQYNEEYIAQCLSNPSLDWQSKFRENPEVYNNISARKLLLRLLFGDTDTDAVILGVTYSKPKNYDFICETMHKLKVKHICFDLPNTAAISTALQRFYERTGTLTEVVTALKNHSVSTDLIKNLTRILEVADTHGIRVHAIDVSIPMYYFYGQNHPVFNFGRSNTQKLLYDRHLPLVSNLIALMRNNRYEKVLVVVGAGHSHAMSQITGFPCVVFSDDPISRMKSRDQVDSSDNVRKLHEGNTALFFESFGTRRIPEFLSGHFIIYPSGYASRSPIQPERPQGLPMSIQQSSFFDSISATMLARQQKISAGVTEQIASAEPADDIQSAEPYSGPHRQDNNMSNLIWYAFRYS